MKILKVDSRGRISLKKLCTETPSHFMVEHSFNRIILTPFYDHAPDYEDKSLTADDINNIKLFVENFIKKIEEGYK